MVSNTRRSNGTGIGVSIGFNSLKVMGDFTLVLWSEIKRVMASSIVLGAL